MLRDDFRRIRAFNFHWKFAEQFIAIIDSNEHRRKVENNSERPSSKVLFTQALPSGGKGKPKVFQGSFEWGTLESVFIFSDDVCSRCRIEGKQMLLKGVDTHASPSGSLPRQGLR